MVRGEFGERLGEDLRPAGPRPGSHRPRLAGGSLVQAYSFPSSPSRRPECTVPWPAVRSRFTTFDGPAYT